MPLHAYPPDIFRMPDYMCWLCRREIEILTCDDASARRPALCRIITFSQGAAQIESAVQISGVGCRIPAEVAPGGLAFLVPHNIDDSVEHLNTREHDLETVSDPVYSEDHRVWRFRVHADCWAIIESRTDNIIACATTWCKALVSLNWNFSPFRRGMRRYDLPRLLLSPAPPCKKNFRKLSIQPLESYESLATELGMSRLSSSHGPVPLSEFGLYLPGNQSLCLAGAGHDVFSKLPEEIIQHIIRFTRTADLVNLRLASKAVAYVSRLTALPKSFWLSRFMPSFELGFALPKHVSREHDWRALYFLIKMTLNCPQPSSWQIDTLFARLTKRRYWWNRLDGVSALDALCGNGHALSGTPFSWHGRPTSKQVGHEDIQPQGPKLIRYVASELRQDDDTSRYMSTVIMSASSISQDVSQIGISTIDMCGHKYVSGLRLIYEGSKATESIGYVMENTETFVHLRPGDDLYGIDVRLDMDAIRGLKILLQDSFGAIRSSTWIGDAASELVIPLQSATLLRRSAMGVPCTLAASFDYFRMLAVGIIEEGEGPPGDQHSETVQVNARYCDESEAQQSRLPFLSPNPHGPHYHDFHDATLRLDPQAVSSRWNLHPRCDVNSRSIATSKPRGDAAKDSPANSVHVFSIY